MSESTLERALKLTLALFPSGPAEYGQVVSNCDDALALLNGRGEEIPDRDTLIREVESRVVIWQARSTSLEDRTGHNDWLTERRSNVDWRFWDRYRRYLEQVELLPPAVISRLDDSTDRVLSKLEAPDRPGEWDRRGIVVGQVQSGKTSHYTGLVCKAADAGYKLIVVLAGIHNSLRSQTQLRLDEGLLGFDTQYQFRYDDTAQSRIGVGAMPGADRLKIGSLTTSHQGGDFKKNRAQSLALPIGDMPVLLVVKKHGGILKNLHAWITQMHGQQVSADSKDLIVPDVPLLIIDDEADNASINTKSADEDPAVINGRIRTLLKAFDMSAYVGYTATPFANIYSSVAEDDDFGMDLFPRHFIESLKPPSNYFGPTRVFGLVSDDNDVAMEPLPIFRPVGDYAEWMPDKHKQDWDPDPKKFPKSLRRSILAFFLVCAARRARGQATKHNSMLIHTTRLQDVQQRVSDQVNDVVTTSRYRLRYGDGDAESLWEELKGLWKEDFERTTKSWDIQTERLLWSDVRVHVMAALDKINVRTINGRSSDALEYYENRQNGLSVIAIGGDKLSRGLTLEGLSVSYYLRATRMYDTLMQMGRWFGYRPGYEDLCRLYTTPLLYDWYREITAASEELRTDFDDMASDSGSTPEKYGLRVRQSAAGLSVTAPSKMRSATSVTMTFSGSISESVTFDVSTATVEKNWTNLDAFVHRLLREEGDAPQKKGNYLWSDVDGSPIAEFFDGYQADRMANRARPQLLSRYIKDGISAGELNHWTVALIGNSKARRQGIISGLELGLTVRSPSNGAEDVKESQRYTIRRVLSPADESIDLTQEQYDAAMDALEEQLRVAATPEKPFKEPEHPRGKTLRRQRSSRRALLLIYPLDEIDERDERLASRPLVGFAASFPFSASNLTTKYQVNETWFKQMIEELDDDDSQ